MHAECRGFRIDRRDATAVVMATSKNHPTSVCPCKSNQMPFYKFPNYFNTNVDGYLSNHFSDWQTFTIILVVFRQFLLNTNGKSTNTEPNMRNVMDVRYPPPPSGSSSKYSYYLWDKTNFYFFNVKRSYKIDII